MQMIMPSLVCRFGARENIFGLMMTGLGKAASKAFGLGALEIPWIGFGRTKGSKPRIVGTTSNSRDYRDSLLDKSWRWLGNPRQR